MYDYVLTKSSHTGGFTKEHVANWLREDCPDIKFDLNTNLMLTNSNPVFDSMFACASIYY